MTFATDWTITPNGAALDIRHASGTDQFTVLELHRALQDFADDPQASGDDILDISTLTPSDRSTDNIVTLLNGANIDDASAQYLYDGSVTQDGGDTIYAGLVVVGSAESNPGTLVDAAISDDGGVFTDETTDANDAGTADVTLLPATAAVNDAFYIGGEDPFQSAEFDIDTAATGTYTIVWEYWDGAAWTELPNISDGTTGFQTTGATSVTFDHPVDWATTSVNAQGPFYYIRARVSAYTSGGGGLGNTISLSNGTHLIIVQNNSVLSSYWGPGINRDAGANILLRTVVKTRSDGADIDGQRLIIQAREFGDTFSEFSVTMALGNNTAAIFTSSDNNNQTATSTISTWDQFTNTEGYQLLNISGSGPEPYYSQWQVDSGGSLPASPTINQLYEYAKYIQRRTTAISLHGINGSLFRGITHEWAYDGITGAEPATNEEYVWGLLVNYDNLSNSFAVGDSVTIGTTTTGRVLSIDLVNTSMVIAVETNDTPADNDQIAQVTSPGTATADVNGAPVGQSTGGGVALILAADTTTGDEVWVQLAKGSAPSDNAVCYEDTDHTREITVAGTVTSRTVSVPFIGSSTGSALLGAFGIGLDPSDTSASDLFVDLDGNNIQPPNNVTFTVSGLESGEDRVLVGPEAGGLLNLNQFEVNVGGVTSGAGSITVKAGTETPGTGSNSETDTPSNGTIRVLGDDGIYYRVTYTGVTFGASTMTFTGCSGLGDDAAADNNVFISYLDVLASGGGTTTESFTTVYAGSPRALFIRVRDGAVSPIKTFETTGTLGSAGGSSTAIRTDDF